MREPKNITQVEYVEHVDRLNKRVKNELERDKKKFIEELKNGMGDMLMNPQVYQSPKPSFVKRAVLYIKEIFRYL